MKQLRLDKYLSDMNVETRSRLKQMIRKGQVTVNGEAATRPEMKVVPGSDRICVLGNPVGYRELEYYLLHKPAGVVSATAVSYTHLVDISDMSFDEDLDEEE